MVDPWFPLNTIGKQSIRKIAFNEDKLLGFSFSYGHIKLQITVREINAFKMEFLNSILNINLQIQLEHQAYSGLRCWGRKL